MEYTQKIEIAIDMLAGTIVDRQWNRLTHYQRNVVTNNVINILENLLEMTDERSNLIIPNYLDNINSPEES
jgi:hypothetical protein